ncbi:hypothetical protein ACFSAG_14115 [Sphingorhabdus buctiana]|uniref:DNA-directed DNA polymerase family A palm domain-containing protein n=1 Tax=Sphingorhabdus buctiana TaxID=1508805 RepID=A0ABW4MH66_9SPHN
MRFLPQDERDIPLSVRFETSGVWPILREMYGLDATGAAIAMALLDAFLYYQMVSYSRSRSHYDDRKNHPLLSYRKVVGAVDFMGAQGLITDNKQMPGCRGWQSAMAGTNEFLESIAGMSDGLPLDLPRYPIELRDKDGRPIVVPPCREVGRMLRQLWELNEVIASTAILSGDGRRLDAALVRIFNKEMSRGGRFYACGRSWQNIPSLERQFVTINGEATTELDFATLHAAMLYSEVGATPPDDSYAIEPWPRDLVKRSFLTLINAKTFQAALGAIANSREMLAFMGHDMRGRLASAKNLISDIKGRHQPVAEFFHKDAGARLMRKDSDLAAAILKKLLANGVVGLPVHDSFLVPASKSAQLEEVMHDCAAQIGLKDSKVTYPTLQPPPTSTISPYVVTF